jgi:signal transduction histidine kinase
VADDGPGGAVVRAGSGLGGLADRVAAAGGRLEVRSPAGRGTVVRAWLPAAGSPDVGAQLEAIR